MGATCEPCNCDGETDSESDDRRLIRPISASIEGETGKLSAGRIPPAEISITRSMSNENLSPVTTGCRSPDNLSPFPQAKPSMSLITAACAFLEAPEQLEADVSNSMSMDSGVFDDIAMDALDYQQDTLRMIAKTLDPVKGWLEKKQNSPPYSWQKRYVVIQDGYLLWSDREITIEKGITEKEKKRWNKCVNLKQIEDVTLVESKKERKFKISIKKESRCWIWKALNKQQRDYWINSLSENIEYIRQKSLFRYISDDS